MNKTCRDCGCQFDAFSVYPTEAKYTTLGGEVRVYKTARSYCKPCFNARNALYKARKREAARKPASPDLDRDNLNYDWYASAEPYPTMHCNPRRIPGDAPQARLKVGRPTITVVSLRSAA